MVWGRSAGYGHFGIDLTGPNGGVVRIEDLRIEDVTSQFLREMMDWVDVRDYGAKGDGITDDRAAFVAADAAANGGGILVPPGEYFIGSDLSIAARLRFQGTLKMPRARLALMQSFDFPTYAAAFGDETLGLKKAIQALLGWVDHTVLDLRGRRVDLTEPLMIHEIAPMAKSWSNRRVIANGQIKIIEGPAWATRETVSKASYDPQKPLTLAEVANIAQIEVGALISGAGVGREVYVRAVNPANREITLSSPLHGGAGTRTYTFTRFRYAFDFSGMDRVDRFNFSDVEFALEGKASGIMLPPSGSMIHIRDCYFTHPKDRGVTSPGRGCQDMLIDRCQFISNETATNVADRTTIAVNVNANDLKMRNSRFVRFLHFLVAGGGGHMIEGNHWFQGDNSNVGLRSAGLILTGVNVQTTVTGNYIDNNCIEMTNEHSASPAFSGNEFSFGALTITGNTFYCHQTLPWFSFIVVKPYGAGHFVQGLTVQGNVFKVVQQRIDRVERVDTSYADLNYRRMRNIVFDGNTFNGVNVFSANPLNYIFKQNTAQAVWPVRMGEQLCFKGYARLCDSILAQSAIVNNNGQRVGEMPWIQAEQGSAKQDLNIHWTTPVRGEVMMRLRMDTPD